MMNKSEFFNKMETLWSDEKSRKFISHLVRNFLPVHKAKYVIFQDDVKDLVCCLTGDKLNSKSEITSLLVNNIDAVTKHTLESMKADINGLPKPKHPLEEYKGTFNLAIRCDGSDRVMGEETYQLFVDWTLSKMLTDNHMGWIVKDMRVKNASEPLKRVASSDSEKNLVKKVENSARTRASFTLGDIDSLQKLSDKLKQEENNK